MAQEAAPTDPDDRWSPTLSLARRLANWATNLFVSGLILLAGLVIGRQVIEAWHPTPSMGAPADPVRTVVGAADPSADATQWIEFGAEPLSVRRSVFQGSVADVLAELRRGCREGLGAGKMPSHLPGPAEQRLLAEITGQQPAERVAGGSLFQRAAPLPLVVAVGPATSPAGSGHAVAGAANRVLSWGLAFPGGDDAAGVGPTWTLFVCASDPAPMSAGKLATPSLPRARHLMTLRAVAGDVICAWTGAADPAEWRVASDQWHRDGGWQPVGDWRHHGDDWHRRYEHAAGGAATMQITTNGRGELCGVWKGSPPGTSP